VTSKQCKEARKLLGISRAKLAKATGIAQAILLKFENSGHMQRAYSGELAETRVATLRTALEAAGVEFTNGDAPGVRLRPRND
jgi:transcriptional regulator with XRE-family HTH domain